MSQPYVQPNSIILQSYADINVIREAFPPLANININHQLDNLDKSIFFVIRTQGEDNVHRAMKYGVWTSSSRKNQKLSDAYKQAEKQGGNVYLFFTEINNFYFSGVAKLVSDFDEKAHFKYWLVENKWFGLFRAEWLYIKDADFTQDEFLKQNQTLDSGSREILKPVHELIDCTELKPEIGKKMLQLFQTLESDKSLFADFSNLDLIEVMNSQQQPQYQQKCRQQREDNPKFERKFQELIKVFEQIPFSFSVASYERRKLHRKQNQMYIQQFYYSPYMMQYQNYYPYASEQQSMQPFQANQQQGNYQGNYWQQNNGFYQKQPNQVNTDEKKQQNNQIPEQQTTHIQINSIRPLVKTQIEEDPALKHIPLQNRFAVKQKKQKNEKKGKKSQSKYIPKNDYQQDPNCIVPQQDESEEETEQQRAIQ